MIFVERFFLSFRDNPSSILGAGFKFPSATDRFVDYPENFMSCKQPLLPTGVPISLPPQVFLFHGCSCFPNYWGDTTTACQPCGLAKTSWELLNCSKGGDEAYFRSGIYPSFDIQNNLVGFDTCPVLWNGLERWSSCNPDKNATLKYKIVNDDSSVLCAEGYEDRLCSRCQPKYFAQGGKCLACSDSKSSLWVFITVISLLSVGIFVFIVMPNVGVTFLWGELAVFVILTVFGSTVSLLAGLLGLLMILHVILEIRKKLILQRMENQEGQSDSRTLISLSGFVKLLIFFVQTNFSVNSHFWEAFGSVSEVFRIFQLQVGNLYCNPTFAVVINSEVGGFLMYMATPVILFLAILLILSLRELVQCLFCRKCAEEKVEARSLIAESDLEKSNDHTSTFSYSVFSLALFVLFEMYYDLAERVLSVFRSSQSKNLTWWMEEMPWIPFDLADGRFFALFISAMVFLLVYVIGIPVLFALLLRFHDQESHAASFLWENYKSTHYWYELVWIGRRLAIAIVVSIVNQESGFSPAILTLVLVMFAAIHSIAQPFKHHLENLFDFLATGAILVTNSVSIWAVNQENLEGIPSAFYFVLALNIVFVVALLAAVAFPGFSSWCLKRRRIEAKSEQEMEGTE